MQHILDPKWLAFYGSAIASVVGLFSITTSYGEANLKAPANISGQYKITSTNLPECLKAKPLILEVEQSGIYLNGSLLEADRATQPQTSSEKQFSLIGLFDQQRLELSGTLSQIAGCGTSAVVIRGAIAQTTLNGTLTLAGQPASLVGQREPTPEKPKH